MHFWMRIASREVRRWCTNSAGPGMSDALAIVQTWATEHELTAAAAGDGSLSVVVPGSQRLRIPVVFTHTPQALVIESFVMRATDEDATAVHAFMLQRNSKAFGIAYAIDASRDVYLVGRIPLASLSVDIVDQYVGNLVSMADGDFNRLLELAYPEAIAREWRWRLSRGEPTENLAAFPHLRPDVI